MLKDKLKVILIGGSPMVGKSTVAVSLAAKLLRLCISTDDIGEALQTISEMNPMHGQDYLDYYANSEKEKLIEDIIEYHKRLQPAIKRLVEIHSAWGNPLIMEGWALYPNQCHFENENVLAVWLIAEGGLLENRLRANKKFYSNAKEPEKVIENYLFRSEWHNRTILNQCNAENQKYIFVKKETTADEIVSQILKRSV